jgi:hypothetical protein
MAKYLVIEAPGIPGPHGFVRPGGILYLPDDQTPSRSLQPLDEAAQKALGKAKAEYVAGLEKRLSELEPARKLAPAKKKALLEVPELPPQRLPDAPPLDEDDEGMSVVQAAIAGEAPRQKRASDG